MATVLLIDDDPGIRYSFSRTFGDDLSTLTADGGPAGLRVLEEEEPRIDLVLLDVRMPGMDGFSVLEKVAKLYPNLPVVIVTAFGDTETAIQAMRQGAYDYLLKPFEIGQVKALVEAACKQRALTRSSVSLGDEDEPDAAGSDQMVGRSAIMLEVYKKVGQASATDLSCLITGATGTGKELVARAVVQHGARSDRPFLVVDCAAIPRDLLEAELFGYEEGAFTGARRGGKIGKFELAEGGTLFLDEIADLPLELQAKLLRTLQSKRIQRVGGGEEIAVDVRILAATCADLEARVAEGTFRQDLFYRVNVFRIHLPALRERQEDIRALVAYFVRKHAAVMGRRVSRVAEMMMDELVERPWPGNVRELENEVRRALAVSHGEVLSLEQSPSAQPTLELPDGLGRLATWALTELPGTVSSPFHEVISRVEAALIAEALQRSAGNLSAAARLLGISRLTLRKKVEEYGARMATAELDEEAPCQ